MNAPTTAPAALPHWDLTGIYPGLQSEAFAQAVIDLKERLTELDAYLIEYGLADAAHPIGSDPSRV
jgi:hypothetical protein